MFLFPFLQAIIARINSNAPKFTPTVLTLHPFPVTSGTPARYSCPPGCPYQPPSHPCYKYLYFTLSAQVTELNNPQLPLPSTSQDENSPKILDAALAIAPLHHHHSTHSLTITSTTFILHLLGFQSFPFHPTLLPPSPTFPLRTKHCPFHLVYHPNITASSCLSHQTPFKSPNQPECAQE